MQRFSAMKREGRAMMKVKAAQGPNRGSAVVRISISPCGCSVWKGLSYWRI